MCTKYMGWTFLPLLNEKTLTTDEKKKATLGNNILFHFYKWKERCVGCGNNTWRETIPFVYGFWKKRYLRNHLFGTYIRVLLKNGPVVMRCGLVVWWIHFYRSLFCHLLCCRKDIVWYIYTLRRVMAIQVHWQLCLTFWWSCNHRDKLGGTFLDVLQCINI